MLLLARQVLTLNNIVMTSDKDYILAYFYHAFQSMQLIVY